MNKLTLIEKLKKLGVKIDNDKAKKSEIAAALKAVANRGSFIDAILEKYGKSYEDEVASSFESINAAVATFTIDGEEHAIIKDENAACDVAVETFIANTSIEDVKQLPWSKSQFKKIFFMTDTDARVAANDIADNNVNQLKDNGIIEQADMEDEYSAAEMWGVFIDGEFKKGEFKTEEDAEMWATNVQKLVEFEIDADPNNYKRQEKILVKAKDKVRDNIFDEVYERLESDPAAYYLEVGYSEDDLFDMSILSLDMAEVARITVQGDWEHFLSFDDYSVSTKGYLIFDNLHLDI